VDAGKALLEKGVEGSKNLRRRRSGFGRNRLCLQSLREPLNCCGIDRQGRRDFAERLGFQP